MLFSKRFPPRIYDVRVKRPGQQWKTLILGTNEWTAEMAVRKLRDRGYLAIRKVHG